MNLAFLESGLAAGSPAPPRQISIPAAETATARKTLRLKSSLLILRGHEGWQFSPLLSLFTLPYHKQMDREPDWLQGIPTWAGSGKTEKEPSPCPLG